MKKLIIFTNSKNLKIENAVVNTFEEEYNQYKRYCKKVFKRTPEFFSLNFNSTLEDLKRSVFVIPGNEEVYKKLKKYYKVLEEI